MNKKEGRAYIKKLRDKMFREETEALMTAQKIITEKFLKSDTYLRAEAVLIYRSTDVEFDTTTIVNSCFLKKKAIFMPRILSKVSEGGKMEFVRVTPDTRFKEKGNLGILEPEGDEFFDPQVFGKVSEVLIPGLCFDLSGNRIGYGGGYYDRYLQSKGREHFHLTALCFSFQMIDSIEAEQHDIPVDRIITEKDDINFKRNQKEF